MNSAYSDHKRVSAVIIEMMIYGRTFDTAQIAEKDGRIVVDLSDPDGQTYAAVEIEE